MGERQACRKECIPEASGDSWFHEVKHDGYRSQVILENGRARVFTRNGLNWTSVIPPLRAPRPTSNARAPSLMG